MLVAQGNGHSLGPFALWPVFFSIERPSSTDARCVSTEIDLDEPDCWWVSLVAQTPANTERAEAKYFRPLAYLLSGFAIRACPCG